ncbi:hypothetical protein BX666DRAFT_2019239 [Dichotomocladium elegans]|nr:hypothetical protein BX666DRAFT_2019239 [Dichotomocladium elegans]
MDDLSRELIEQMLAEEEYYYGTDTLATMPSKKRKKLVPKKQQQQQQQQKSEAISSATLPSHKTRWSSDEDDRLRTAIELHGYGNWKLIASEVKTRNPLQCKNRARHWVMTDKLEKGVPKSQSSGDPDAHTILEKPNEDNSKPTEIFVSQSHADELQDSNSDNKNDNDGDMNNDDEDDEEISITEDGDEGEAHSLPFPTTENESDEKFVEFSDPESILPKEEKRTPASPDVENDQDDSTTVKTSSASEDKEEEEEEGEGENEKEQTHGERDDEKNMPLGHLDDSRFDRYAVSEEEKECNPEWFKNKASKTPDRYLRIRNHILDAWQACRPRYLTKTSARRGLKDCGDVNAIGRVHEYLENIGAINVECVNSAPRPPKRVAATTIRKADEDDEADMFAAADLVIGYEGPRKRKVRDENGEWVDPKELEGRVIEHVPQQDPRPKRIQKRPKHFTPDEFGRGYDPFQLVPLEYYSNEDPAPFVVEIMSNALLVMDFHAHLAHTEIIGLLGGNFDPEAKVLRVLSVFPCKSTSTGIQCEMDPESEMKAREEFTEKGLIVVGWYHSHPTFEPNPSIRDIENQTSYQTLFRHENTGDEPFIGVIVTPYDTDIVIDHSQIQYLHISPRWNDTRQFRTPYACRRRVIQNERTSPDVMKVFEQLMDEFKDYQHKVDMLSPFTEARSRLDKLLDSLRSNLFLPADQVAQFLERVRRLCIPDNNTVNNNNAQDAAEKVKEEEE